MNLDTINSPIDLILQNEVEPTVDEHQTPVETVCDIVFSNEPDVGYDVLETIVDALIRLHQQVLTDKVEEGDVDSVVFWTKDLQNLRTIRSLLDNITR